MATNTGFEGKNTSLITILSTVHGQLRREQRDIDKRDLQRALKYGRCERAWGQRWLVEYDGITFITDLTKRREVTAYPSPLPDIPVNYSTLDGHEKAKRLLQQKPELSTSHTVIVVDNSGSMLSKKNDVHLYRDSQNAAFSMTALEFVAEQLLSNTAVNSDMVSLVKFGERPSIEFSREPIGWPVYNKILTHRNKDKYVNRQHAPYMDEVLGGSNYLPALKAAQELLELGHHDKCAKSIFFFSDGRHTDHMKLGITSEDSIKRMKETITSMSSKYGEALTVSMVGLGNAHDLFLPLKEMANAATDAGAKGSFERCEKTAHSISSAISSMVTSTTETRLTLQEGGRSSFTERSGLTSEKYSFPKCNWTYFKIVDHFVYHPQVKEFRSAPMLPLAAVHSSPVEASRRMQAPPPYIAINSNYVGKGAERVAFRCRLSDAENPRGFVFEDMVAKETKHDQRIGERVAFHEGFAETQDLANYLATEFNKHLQAIPNYRLTLTPQLRFVSCSVLLLQDSNWPGGERGVLVEKMLDTDRFRWVKWNDNNGGLMNGEKKHIPIDVDFELKELQREEAQHLGAIMENDEDSDDDESISDVESEGGHGNGEVDVNSNDSGIDPSEYLQAFTHFTYRFTNKKVMVCDLQGIFNTDLTPPTIEMTDPAIHYASTRGRRMVFGRTDKGRSGMNAFFSTHKCTKICKYLHLSARNKKWNRDWRRESTQRTNFRHN
ncbi:hypothetical protein ACHAXR_011560 [Thalassiosira sp. AJA248-18]